MANRLQETWRANLAREAPANSTLELLLAIHADHTPGFLRVRRDAERSSAQADLRHLHTTLAEQGVLHR
jgi:hypothetical protein